MNKLLYWEPCDKTIHITLPASGKVFEQHITREFKCSHPKITKAWFWGGGSPVPGTPLISYLEILAENGERYCQVVTPEEMETGNIPKAEEWLQSLPTN